MNDESKVIADVSRSIDLGAGFLFLLCREKRRVTFADWAALVCDEAKKANLSLTDQQLDWLWNVVTSEPAITKRLGVQIVSRDQGRNRKPVPVLEAGSVFGIFLKGFSAYGSPTFSLPANLKPEARIILSEDLHMIPGRTAESRYRCDDVECNVEIDLPRPSSPKEEAVLMKLKEEAINVEGEKVVAKAKSLNNAYTIASRRLQPNRRSHGGRIYDHLALRKGDQWIILEEIRTRVEKGTWESDIAESPSASQLLLTPRTASAADPKILRRLAELEEDGGMPGRN